MSQFLSLRCQLERGEPKQKFLNLLSGSLDEMLDGPSSQAPIWRYNFVIWLKSSQREINTARKRHCIGITLFSIYQGIQGTAPHSLAL
jgi:hypothetical protein